MTTLQTTISGDYLYVVEAYRLDRYDNFHSWKDRSHAEFVVEAYRLDRYDNLHSSA